VTPAPRHDCAPAPQLDVTPAPRPDSAPALQDLLAVPTYRDRPATLAADVSGVGLGGEPVGVRVTGTGRWTLLVFLSTGCRGCLQIWEAVADPVGSGLATDEKVVVVTRDPGEEDLGSLRSLAPGEVPVVMSSAAWTAYRVQGPPFFALVDGREAGAGDRRVATEGVAWGVTQIADHVRRARSGA
jgi:hypothetical protein